MKKICVLITLLLIANTALAQKKNKIRGTKFVVVNQHKLPAFSALDVGENFEVYLTKGTSTAIEIEADDNLHDVIDFSINDKTLYLSSSKKIAGAKAFKIRITYTNDFNTIIAKQKATIHSLTDIDLEDLSITAKDNTRVYLTLKSQTVKVIALDRAKTELNITANSAAIEMSDASDMKALINANNLVFDLYQKANATIEGDIDHMKVRTDNATNFDGKNLTAVKAEVILEGSSDCIIEAKEHLIIEASGNSEIQIYNNPTIELRKFSDAATLYKKQ